MATLGDAITKLAKSAGIPDDNEQLKNFLSNVAVSGANFPDELDQKISLGLLTIESAKSNPTLKAHYFAQAFNGLDNEVATLMTGIELDEAIKTELLSEKSTPKKVSGIIKKIADLRKEAQSATGDDKKELVTKINNLTNQLSQIEAKKAADIQAEVDKVKATYEAKFDDMEITRSIASEKLANPLGWDSNLVTDVAKQTFQKALAAKGLKAVRTENGIELQNPDGTKPYEGTQEVKYSDFLKKTLLEAKLLDVGGNQNQQQQQNQNQHQNNQQQRMPGNGQNKFAERAAEVAESAPTIS